MPSSLKENLEVWQKFRQIDALNHQCTAVNEWKYQNPISYYLAPVWSVQNDLTKTFAIQVNICQKLLFFHQQTHNMMTDCSLFMKIVSSEYLQNMLCTQIVVFVLFWHSEQFWYTTSSADVVSFWKRFTCTNWQIFYNSYDFKPDSLVFYYTDNFLQYLIAM